MNRIHGFGARALIVALATAFAACSGGTHAVPTAPGSTPARHPARVTFHLKVPPKREQLHGHRHGHWVHGHYVSPSTMGLGINYWTTSSPTVDANDPNVAFDLSSCTPATNCTSNADGSQTFTITAPVPPASSAYTFEVTTWTQPPSGGVFSNAAQILSQGSAALSVTSGAAPTTLNLTLNAEPATVSFIPIPGQSHVRQDGSTFSVVGNAPVDFIANALDAGGNLIFGQGAPTITVADTDATPYFSLSSSTTATNVWALQAIAVDSTGGAQIGVTATPPAGSGFAPTAATFAISTDPELWLSGNAGSGPQGLWGYALDPTNGFAPTIFPIDFTPLSSTSNNSYVAIDTKGQPWILVQNSGLPEIERLTAPSGALPPQQTSDAIALISGDNVGAITIDGSDRLYLPIQYSAPLLRRRLPRRPDGVGTGSQVAVYDLSGGTPTTPLTSVPTSSAQFGVPYSVAVAPSTSAYATNSMQGSIWVAGSNGVDAMTWSGTTLTDTYHSGAPASPAAIALGNDGIVWVASGSGTLSAYTFGFTSGFGLTLAGSVSASTGNQIASDQRLSPSSQVWLPQLDACSGTNPCVEAYDTPSAPVETQTIAPPTTSSYAQGIAIAP